MRARVNRNARAKKQGIKVRVKSLLRVLGLTLFAGVTAPAWSIPISTTGGLDRLIAETRLGNSGDGSEAAWVASVLGFNILLDERIEGHSVWQAVQGAALGTYAIDFGLGDAPSYFLIKTGNVTNDGNRHFLFENLATLRYGVMFLGQMGISITNIKGVSHTTEFGGGPTVVAEPGTLLLLLAGFAAAALALRRRA
jgi:hypothetical protein